MNVRFESGSFPKVPQQKLEDQIIAESYQNADKTEENQLIQQISISPEHTKQDIEEAKRQLEKSYLSNNDERMRQALSRFKNQQVEGGYFSNSTSTMDNLPSGNSEIIKEVETTSITKTENQISDPVEMMRVAYQEKKATETASTKSSIDEKQNGLTKQLRTLEKLLERGKQENDEETIELAEMQISELKKILQENNVVVPHEEKKEQETIQEVDPIQEEVTTKQEQTPEETTKEKIAEEQNETVSSPEILPPSQDILYKLQEMQIKYEDLVQVVPDFASMSEGQQAYILAKSEEQGLEQIQERADKDFQRKMAEQKGFLGGLKKVFQSGKFRREANRNAVNQHTGLNAFSKDIEHLTKHVSENGWDINLNQDGTYQIEYISKPEGTTEREAMFFDNYNRYATALSDIPYEWGLPTASSAQKKAYKEAYENFGKCEKALRTALEQDGEEHPDILRWTFKTRGEIELNQFFSNERDISEKLDNMKNASFKSDLVKKIFTADGLTKTGLKTGIVASSFGARIFSKALYGLGGAMGASAIIGGILGWRQKSAEFKQDEKNLRRQGVTQEVFERLKNQDKEYQNLLKEFNKFGKRESLSSEEKQKLDPIINAMHARERMFKNQEMGIKSTDKSVFDAKANTERINKLLMKVANEKDPLRREKSLNALQDRLQILDERLKAGRVNFGKTKDQLENKTALMEALVQAHVYKYELSEREKSGDARKVDTRISGYFEKQDKQSGKERFNEKTKNAIKKSAAASAITGVVAGLWMISEYFGGDDTVKAIKAAIDTNIDPTPVKLPNPTDFEVSVDASPRGAIATYENLQQELIEKYPNPELRPPHVQEFIDTPAEKLAMEDNMYRPGEVNESAKIFKGGKLGFNANGERFYTDARNGMDILSGEGKFDGEHFDFKSYSEAKVAPENVGSGTVGESAVKPGGAENIFDTPKPAEELQLGVTKEVNISKNLNVDFSIDKGIRGGLVSTFHDVNPDDFNAYHKAYLKTDIKSYVDYLSKETNFFRDNVGISQEQANSQLKDLVNQMIMRDQVLQEGNLDPNSEVYKILTNERNEIEGFINKKFGNSEDIIYNFDGKRYPDPNFGISGESVESSQGVESQPENVVTPETTNTPEVKTVRMRNNVIGQDFDFRFTKTPDGSLMYSNETIDPNKIPNEYIEKRLGFNPDWRKDSELLQSFENSKLNYNINGVKAALAGLDSFPPNTEEYQTFRNGLKTYIKIIEEDYPAVFNLSKIPNLEEFLGVKDVVRN